MKRTILLSILFTLIGLIVNGASLYNSIPADSIKTKSKSKLEIDLQFGLLISTPRFYNGNRYIKNLNDNSTDEGSTYFFGIAVPMRKNLFLRTELGIMQTFSQFEIEYESKYVKNDRLIKNIVNNNIRAYFGFMPEYRLRAGIMSFKIFGGPFFTTNLLNTCDSGQNNAYLRDDIPLGFKVGAGFIILHKTIGFTYNCSYVKLPKVDLFGDGPKISYSQIQMNCGVVYAIQ